MDANVTLYEDGKLRPHIEAGGKVTADAAKGSVGQQVAKGDLLVVLESMKMENYVYAPVKGAVTKIFVGPAAGVEAEIGRAHV